MQKAVLALVAALAVLSVAPQTSAQDDVDYLNFALQLECLEASFYSYAAFGINLSPALLGGAVGRTGGPVYGGQAAALKGAPLSYAVELANDEINHLVYLRTALGNLSVPCPPIDIGSAFSVVANAAVGETLAPAFSPYFDYLNFYLGAFIFEDVGVTAYHGAIPALLNKDYVLAAAKLLGTESYHAGILRLALSQNGYLPTQTGGNVTDFANAIAALRFKLGGGNDVGITFPDGSPRITDADSMSVAFSRTPEEVLAIVYGTGSATKPGGFFPSGVNGYYSPANLINGRKKKM